MKLEEFFTLVEMKNGLSSLSRVEQLVNLMHQDKSHISKNTADATHHWSTLASVLSVTKNADYVRQFVQLGGLRYLDRWLQEALKHNINKSDMPLEEVINAVLEALENLPMDKEGLKSSGIANALRHLHSHKNLEIQGRARNLSANWQKIICVDMELQENSEGGPCRDCDSRCMAATAQTMDVENPNYEKASFFEECSSKGETIGCKLQQPSFAAAKENKVQFSAQGASEEASSRDSSIACLSVALICGPTSPKEVSGNRTDTKAPQPFLEAVTSTKHVSLKSGTDLDPTTSFQQAEIKELDVGKRVNVEANNVDDGSMPTVIVGSEEKEPGIGFSSLNRKKPFLSVSFSNVGCQKALHEADQCNADINGKGKIASISVGNNFSLEKQPPKNVDDGSLNYWKKIMERKTENQTDEHSTSNAMKNSPTRLLGKQGSFAKASHDADSFRTDNGGDELYVCIKSGSMTKAEEKLATGDKIATPNVRVYQKKAEEMIRKGSEIEVAYEEDDALEVARQVAKEVVQEVGIYGEASCSSSSVRDTNCETVQMDTADSLEIKKNKSLTRIGDKSESCIEHDVPDSCCFTEGEVDIELSAGNDDLCLEAKHVSQKICATALTKDDKLQEQESSQLTTVPHESAVSDRTYLCSFDLNEDAQTDEIECPEESLSITVSPSYVVNLPTPIPVVATSRGPVGLSVTPVHFEGELGWKGSAPTSAFRPASPRRTPDMDRTCSAEEKKCNSKNLPHFCGIDLNVADVGDGAVIDLFSGKHVSVSSNLPSGESSVEVSSRRAERLNLDLNRLGDNDDNCQDLVSNWTMGNTHYWHMNGACNPSESSLSRPSLRDFDLNYTPSFGNAHELHRPGQGTRPLKSGRLDEPVVSILGSRVQLEPNVPADFGSVQDFAHGHFKNEFLSPTQSFLLSARGVAPSIGQMGRVAQVQPTLAYGTPPAFPYNGLGMGLTIPLPSAVYTSGAVPYMVDSRGATVIPHLLGSSGSLPPFPAAPYLMGVAGAPGANDIGMLRPNLDLNTGLTSLDTDARGGNARHMFFPTNNSLVEEQLKPFQKVSFSGPSLKRKEPECRWDPYQFGYKHATSWH